MTWFGGAHGGEFVDPYAQDALHVTSLLLYSRDLGGGNWGSDWTGGPQKWQLAGIRQRLLKGNIPLVSAAEDSSYGGCYGYNEQYNFDFWSWDYRQTPESLAVGGQSIAQAWNTFRNAHQTTLSGDSTTNIKAMVIRYRNGSVRERHTSDGSALVPGESATSDNPSVHVAYGVSPPTAQPNNIEEGDEWRFYWFPSTFTLPTDINVEP